MSPAWTAFALSRPDLARSICERIGDALWNHQRGAHNGLTIADVHEHNQTNHTISGAIELPEGCFEFIYSTGDMGSEMADWGDDVGIYEPPEPAYTSEPARTVKPADVPHEWRLKRGGTVDGFFVSARDGYYTCSRCGRDALGEYCISTHGDAWYEEPRNVVTRCAP